VLAGVVSLAALAPTQASAAALGHLSVSGGQIVDAAGAPVVLHSTSAGGMAAGNGNSAPDDCLLDWALPRADLATDVKAAGFNSVRLGISWANLEPTAPVGTKHTWNQVYLQALDTDIQRFTSVGVSVIIEMHQSQWSPAFKHFKPPNSDRAPECEGIGMPTWLYPGTPEGLVPDAAKCEFFVNKKRAGVPVAPLDGFVEAWKFVAARYASNPGVIAADMLNEPGWSKTCHPPTDTLVRFHERVGQAIHQANARLLLIAEDGTLSYYLTRGFAMTRKPNVPNLVFSWHWYPPNWDRTRQGRRHETGKESLQAHADRAREWGVPFWVGEFNAFNQAFNNPAVRTDKNWKADTLAMMAWAKAAGVGWSFYAFDVGSGGSLVDPLTGKAKPDILAALRTGM
jgi:hypothetical protein